LTNKYFIIRLRCGSPYRQVDSIKKLVEAIRNGSMLIVSGIKNQKKGSYYFTQAFVLRDSLDRSFPFVRA